MPKRVSKTLPAQIGKRQNGAVGKRKASSTDEVQAATARFRGIVQRASAARRRVLLLLWLADPVEAMREAGVALPKTLQVRVRRRTNRHPRYARVSSHVLARIKSGEDVTGGLVQAIRLVKHDESDAAT